MNSIRINYLKHIIFVDAIPTENQTFSAEAQIAGPSGFINITISGVFETATSATDFSTHWVKQWIDSGCAKKALADAFTKLRA